MYQARYLSGMVAGSMTKSNVLGYVAAFPMPEVIRGINAFTLGAQAVNPKAEVRVVWTKTWYDPVMSSFAPKSHLVAPIWNWTPFYSGLLFMEGGQLSQAPGVGGQYRTGGLTFCTRFILELYILNCFINHYRCVNVE